MTDFEDELRRQLRPVDAPQGFADRVMRALPVDDRPALVSSTPSQKSGFKRVRQFGMPAALAASLLAAVLLGQYAAVERNLRAEREGAKPVSSSCKRCVSPARSSISPIKP
jgi:hypothetical protein